jgi:hypothetical protein
MRIFDPSHGPGACFGPLVFELIDETDPHGDIRVRSASGVELAELLRLGEAHGQMALGEPELVLPLDGCWRLEVFGADGALAGSYVMCPAADSASDQKRSTQEVIVWATLTLMWAMNRRPHNRG